MKFNLFKGKSTRTKTYSIVTVAAILILFVLNLVVRNLALYGNGYIDMTPEGLYTVSDKMREQCGFIDKLDDGDKELKITFCTDPDHLTESTVTRLTYFMAIALDNMFDNLTVETVNVAYNPTAVDDYKTTSLSKISSSDVIISYGDRYRIASAESFWVTSNNTYFSYNGEYKMASLLMSVTAVNRPAAYFVTDHGETYYDPENPKSEASQKTAAFYDLLTERGLEVKTLSLSTEQIPEDCVLLIINNPRTDLTTDPDKYDSLSYISEAEKLDRYLVKSYGSIMVSKDYALSLPVLDDFLYEWGFDLGNGLIRDEESSLIDEDGSNTNLIGIYDTAEDSYGYAIYGDYASLSSAPSMIFENVGGISCSFGDQWSGTEAGTYAASKNYAPFFYTSSAAKTYEYNDATGGYTDLSGEGVMHLAGVTTRYEIDRVTSEHKYSYLFCANSPDMFASSTLGKHTYANYDILSALVNNMARTDEYASIELGGLSYNSPSIGGKQLVDTTIYSEDQYYSSTLLSHGLSATAITIYTVIIFAIPAVIAVYGIVRLVKRRFL